LSDGGKKWFRVEMAEMMENSPELAETYKNSPLGPRKQRAMLMGPNEGVVPIPEVKITAIIQTYQAAEGLEQTLKSLQGNVDRVLVLDGYFSMAARHKHPDKIGSGASTDNSKEITRKYGAEWIPADREYRTQIDKLNRIPELVKEGDWILLIDTDEVLVSYIRDGLHAVVGWFSQWCDAITMKLDEPYFTHPWTGQFGRHRFFARLMKVLPGIKWTNESCIIYPGRVNLYMGTFPSTVFLRHLRKGH